MSGVVETQSWAEETFGACELGDVRRTKRLVRVASILMPVPPQVKALNPAPIPMQLVRVREVNVSAGVTPIEWLLWTSLPVENVEQAFVVVEDYESRWLIEEYHKALKSGCVVTERQRQSSSRLEPMVGLISVIAVHLLKRKTASVSRANRPARTMVPPLWLKLLWLKLLKAIRGRKLRRVHAMPIYEFYREVAKLGGFIGRKSNGEPGWITIWRGCQKLATLIRGAKLLDNLTQKYQICG